MLRKLFSSKEDPVTTYRDPILGKLVWDSDEESWRGTFRDQRFMISYDRSSSEPLARLIDYALSVLTDDDWLRVAVADAKKDYLAKHPRFGTEVDALFPIDISFIPHKRGDFMHIALGEPVPDHFWFVEFHGRKLTHFGFST
jgi:hypothetical protein